MEAIKYDWPPDPALWEQYKINAAWYSGDYSALKQHGGTFWKGTEKNKLHISIAADIAALAAGLIFSGSPTIKSDDKATDKRLQEILAQIGIYQLLLMGAELQSAYGGVFLKLNWDKMLINHPILQVVPADNGVAEYKLGVQISSTLYSQVYASDDGKVYRLREKYKNDGTIESSLLRGDAYLFGDEVPLTTLKETAEIAPVAKSGTKRLLAIYVPNRKPNRQMPYSQYGASDYDGIHGMFDALDEAYSSLMRDIRLGKARVIVPMEWLRRKELLLPGIDANPKQWAFDLNEEVFTALDIDPSDEKAGISTVQPEIRATAMLDVITDLVRRIYMMAGYAPQSAGIDITGSAESGTALNVRERRSMQTAEMKKTYWWHALLELTKSILALDKAVFQNGVNLDAPLTIAFADNTQPDMQTVASTVQQMSAAYAASTVTKVKMLHPDWDETAVAAEVLLIRQEDGKDYDDGDNDPPSPKDGDLEGDLNEPDEDLGDEE